MNRSQFATRTYLGALLSRFRTFRRWVGGHWELWWVDVVHSAIWHHVDECWKDADERPNALCRGTPMCEDWPIHEIVWGESSDRPQGWPKVPCILCGQDLNDHRWIAGGGERQLICPGSIVRRRWFRGYEVIPPKKDLPCPCLICREQRRSPFEMGEADKEDNKVQE